MRYEKNEGAENSPLLLERYWCASNVKLRFCGPRAHLFSILGVAEILLAFCLCITLSLSLSDGQTSGSQFGSANDAANGALLSVG